MVGYDKGFMLYFFLQSQLGYVLWVAKKVLKMHSFLCHYLIVRKSIKKKRQEKKRKENEAHQRCIGKRCVYFEKKTKKKKEKMQ